VRPVQRPDGKWVVLDESDDEIAGPFDTEDEAWDWIDEHTPKTPRPKF